MKSRQNIIVKWRISRTDNFSGLEKMGRNLGLEGVMLAQ